MRYWPLVVLVILFGAAFGIGLTVMELGASLIGPVDASVPTPAPIKSPDGPRVVADQEEFNFGSMERDSHKSHVFTIHNEGRSLLVLKKGESTCRCTKFDIAQTDIKPGDSTTVAIEWKATVPPGPFRQSATIETNDPARPELTFTITGDVTSSLRILPDSIVFSGISINEPQTAEVHIFSYRPEPLKVANYEFMETASADKFEFHSESMPTKMLEEESDAKSGLVLHVTVKPGLPLGSFRQKIKINLNQNDNSFELPIEGNTISDVVIAGPNWDDDHSLLTLGTVSGREGVKAQLFILAHGPHRKQLRPVVKEVNPDVLKVTFGDITTGADDGPVRVPVTIQIPPGLPPMLHLGGQEGKVGEILIDTNDPEAATVRIRVRFAIGE
jgi:Protein of unknown function (DUF1573)